MKVLTDTVGLNVALELYGSEAINEVGNWLSPASVEIPEEDLHIYNKLVQEERDKNLFAKKSVTPKGNCQ